MSRSSQLDVSQEHKDKHGKVTGVTVGSAPDPLKAKIDALTQETTVKGLAAALHAVLQEMRG